MTGCTSGRLHATNYVTDCMWHITSFKQKLSLKLFPIVKNDDREVQRGVCLHWGWHYYADEISMFWSKMKVFLRVSLGIYIFNHTSASPHLRISALPHLRIFDDNFCLTDLILALRVQPVTWQVARVMGCMQPVMWLVAEVAEVACNLSCDWLQGLHATCHVTGCTCQITSVRHKLSLDPFLDDCQRCSLSSKSC